ncbi:class I SAM-dependent methyltransferase [Cellulomonas soli]
MRRRYARPPPRRHRHTRARHRPRRGALPADEGSARFVHGTAEQLPCDDASVDALTMVMVLHHTEPARALAEVRRVLRPGGLLIVLGYGRAEGLRDLPLEVRDVVAHRWYSRGTNRWEPPVALADPDLTWSQTRRLLHAELPGGTYRRLPMWRYLYTWEAPV